MSILTQSFSGATMPEQKTGILHGEVTAGQWILPVLMLMAGGGAGYFGHDLTTEQQPAVLAQGLEQVIKQQTAQKAAADEDRKEVKEDIAELKKDLGSQLEKLASDIKENRDLAQERTRKRFSTDDHKDWLERIYHPQQEGQDRTISTLQRRMSELEAR